MFYCLFIWQWLLVPCLLKNIFGILTTLWKFKKSMQPWPWAIRILLKVCAIDLSPKIHVQCTQITMFSLNGNKITKSSDENYPFGLSPLLFALSYGKLYFLVFFFECCCNGPKDNVNRCWFVRNSLRVSILKRNRIFFNINSKVFVTISF